ncbi:MAG: hypothetical protein ABGW82_08155, partial [Paracoccus sp. (in: a-proteobacteria)]
MLEIVGQGDQLPGAGVDLPIELGLVRQQLVVALLGFEVLRAKVLDVAVEAVDAARHQLDHQQAAEEDRGDDAGSGQHHTPHELRERVVLRGAKVGDGDPVITAHAAMVSGPGGQTKGRALSGRARLDAEFEAGTSSTPNKADWLDGKWAGFNIADQEEDARRGVTGVDLPIL